VFEDRLNHASLIDAAFLSGARLTRYAHKDTENLRRKMAQAGSGHRLIASDGVFSMDGDCAPLVDLAGLAAGVDAWLLIDDAHGFGVLGRQGSGWCVDQLADAPDNTIMMATLGKAVGTFGAFVAGSDALIETLIQQARTYIYTTAPPPALAWATRTALQLVRDGDDLREKLRELVRHFRSGAAELGLPLTPSETPIQPLLVGGAGAALALSAALRDQGVLVTAIRPPTVAKGAARLRITLSARHERAQLDRLLETLASCYGESSCAAR
jgi:8-amino-7-oxononanoate synthase